MRTLLLRILCLFGLYLSAASCFSADAVPGRIALAAALDRAGQPVTQSSTYNRGDTVYLAVQYLEGYKGLESRVTWRQGDKVVQTDAIKLDRAAERLDPLWGSAQLQTQADWPVGAYRCEVFIPDQGTTTLEFELK